MRQLLRKDVFDDATVMALEFADQAAQRRQEEPPKAIAIYYESDLFIDRIEVHYDVDGKPQADLSPLLSAKKLVFYSGLESGPFIDIQKSQSGRSWPKIINLIDFIENYGHFPCTGLELDTLTGYIGGTEGKLRGRERVPAIRQVLDWVRSSL